MKFEVCYCLLAFFIVPACNGKADKTQHLQNQIDSLEKKFENGYRPGLGEFMSSIQLHHAKLWFAGVNKNWKLADFEIQEIQESVEAIQEFNNDRPEVKEIGMIKPSIDSVSKAIKEHNVQSFKNSYFFLTNTCNNCHRATEHSFNVVTIPSAPPVVNQDFKPAQ